MNEVIVAAVAVVSVMGIFWVAWSLATKPDPERNARSAAIYTREMSRLADVPKSSIPALVGAILGDVPEVTMVRVRYDTSPQGRMTLMVEAVIPWPRAIRRADLERLERRAKGAANSVAPEWMQTRVTVVRR